MLFERLKKLYILLKVIRTKEIVEAPLSILKQMSVKRLPEEILNEHKKRRKLFPLKTLLYLYDWLKYETITQMPDGRFVINGFLPPMPGQGYKRMFENLLSGRRLSPVSAYLAVSSTCCYQCWHCSYKNREGQDLTLLEIENILDQLLEIGTSIVGITGGEPTLRKDIVQIVAKASIFAECMLFTNGFNFTEALALQLKEAGLWAVAVSLDSHMPEIHNKKRGHEQAFERAIKAIEIARTHGFYTMLCTVPDIDMVKDGTYKNIYKLAEKYQVDEYRIVEPMPSGKLFGCSDKLLSTEQREEIRQFHRYINQQNQKPKVCAFAQVESAEYFGCCAGTMHLFIDSFGNVCPCDFTPLSFGNLKEISLTECWKRLNKAFVMPRSKCFMQHYHEVVGKYYKGTLPVDYEDALQILEEVPLDPLPGYFKHVLSLRNSE